MDRLDADLAKAFGESLGVDVEFVEIEWGSKIRSWTERPSTVSGTV